MRRLRDGWIQNYLKYTKTQESPEMFHFWVAASLISTVTARKVYISQGFFNVYPNMFIVLVAGSQKCRKSTAIHMGVDLLKSMTDYQPYLLSQKMTPESLIDALSTEAITKNIESGDPKGAGLIVADELSTYLDSAAIQRGMLPVLLKMYDCTDPFEYKTKGGGTQSVPKPYLNILAGSSPEYLKISLPSNEVGGGMLARTLLVYQEKPRRARPFIEFDKEQESLRKDLIYDLMCIAELKGAFTIDPPARKWFEDWYYTWHADKLGYDRDTTMENYNAKKPDHLFKLAQVISISDSSRLTISVTHFERALEFLNLNEQLMPMALGTILTSGSGIVTKRVYDVIRLLIQKKQRDGVEPAVATRKEILSQIHKEYDFEEMNKALETLLQAGSIDIDTMAKPRGFVLGE